MQSWFSHISGFSRSPVLPKVRPMCGQLLFGLDTPGRAARIGVLGNFCLGMSYHVYPRTLDLIPRAVHDPGHCPTRQDHSAHPSGQPQHAGSRPRQSWPSQIQCGELRVERVVCDRLESKRVEAERMQSRRLESDQVESRQSESNTFVVKGPGNRPVVVAGTDPKKKAGIIETLAANGLPQVRLHSTESGGTVTAIEPPETCS